jgi:hypothetical protein
MTQEYTLIDIDSERTTRALPTFLDTACFAGEFSLKLFLETHVKL